VGQVDAQRLNGEGLLVRAVSTRYSARWASSMSETGLAMGLHSLRHFFASWAIQQGFAAERLQALGHSSIQMTFDVYGHLFPSLEDDHAKVCGRRAAHHHRDAGDGGGITARSASTTARVMRRTVALAVLIGVAIDDPPNR